MSKPEINVTPLIDVLLVLLIIFMAVTPMRPSSFQAKIPREPKNGGVEPAPGTLIVIVDTEGKLRLNNEPKIASIEEPGPIIERLREVFSERERNLSIERTVFIRAPRRLEYGSVAKVVDAVKTADAAPISLQIDNLE